MPKEITPGQWRSVEYMVDYRIERLSDMLVERATWNEDAPSKFLSDTVVAEPGYIWFRFWSLKSDYVVEKYFDDSGRPVGIYAPVCTSFAGDGQGLKTTDLVLALWITSDGQVMVMNEADYEISVESGLISPDEADEAERRIREMTLTTAQRLFPLAIIRNFELDTERPE